MPLITWKNTYSVGIEHLDKQHKGLVDQINTLHEAMKLGKAKDSLNDILNTLIDYTSTHFESEEKLFAKYNFPESKQHIDEHAKFVKEVLSFKDDYDKGRITVTFEVMDFLKNWLINHILVSDMNYKDFLNSNGIY